MNDSYMVRLATVNEEITGIGPSGRGVTVDPGQYVVADIDGDDQGVLTISDPAAESDTTALARVRADTVRVFEITREAYNKVKPGHILEPDHTRIMRWTCRTCGDAVLDSGAHAYGSVTERTCEESQAFWANARSSR